MQRPGGGLDGRVPGASQSGRGGAGAAATSQSLPHRHAIHAGQVSGLVPPPHALPLPELLPLSHIRAQVCTWSPSSPRAKPRFLIYDGGRGEEFLRTSQGTTDVYSGLKAEATGSSEPMALENSPVCPLCAPTSMPSLATQGRAQLGGGNQGAGWAALPGRMEEMPGWDRPRSESQQIDVGA